MNRVYAKRLYFYYPVFLDRYDNYGFEREEGMLVRVVNKYGCPPANTMNHCYIEDAYTHEFLGLVCCDSLSPWKPILTEEEK